MASGHVDAGPPVLKTLPSLNPGRVSVPLPLPPTLLGPPFVSGKVPPVSEMLTKNFGFVKCFRVWGRQGSLKDPPRTLQGAPKQPSMLQKDPQCPPKNFQMLKT